MASDGNTETIQLTVPAQAEFVRIVRLVMAGIGNSLAFNVEEINDLKMAVAEAYNMFHPSLDSPLQISTAIEPGRLVIDVSQQYDGRAPRLLTMEHSTERGIGMILLKHLMDKVEYCTDPTEMHVRLIKYRTASHT